MAQLIDHLDGPRARDAFVLRVVMQPPWAMDVGEDAALTVVAMLSGECWLRRADAPPTRLEPGDVMLVPDRCRYVLGDTATTPPRVFIGVGQSCSAPDGHDLSGELDAGVRTWGNDPVGRDRLLVASYGDRAQLGQLQQLNLPEVTLIRAVDSPLLPVLAAEAAVDDLAQSSVLDRMLDVVLISVVRAWLRDQPQPATRLQPSDPAITAALQAIRAEPQRRWTLETLAGAAGVSRSALARRFRAAVGMGPIAYLAGWRLTLAAELLTSSDRTLAAVAREVGYGSPFSLSVAFKKRYGVSPQVYRSAD